MTGVSDRIAAAAALWSGARPTPASPDDLIVEKKSFTLSRFTTQGGHTLRDVRVGWESYGRLAEDRGNVVLVCHFFSANSHAAGKYEPGERVPGYWDAIIGPGKAIDTNRWFVLSVDSLANLNVGDPNTTTTGPASLDPATGRPYGSTFPVVTIGDFVEMQRELLDSLGIGRLHAVAGPSMGSLQTYEWAARHPDRVGRIIPVIGTPLADAHLIAWLDAWGAPIRLDPHWNGGDYYGGTPPTAGLVQALKLVSLHANHWAFAGEAFGRAWADPAVDPASALDARFLADAALEASGTARAHVADANHLLWLAKACQLFAAGGGSATGRLDEVVARLPAPTLLVTSPRDQIFHEDGARAFADAMRRAGRDIRHLNLQGDRGHLDGVLGITQAARDIRTFLEE